MLYPDRGSRYWVMWRIPVDPWAEADSREHPVCLQARDLEGAREQARTLWAIARPDDAEGYLLTDCGMVIDDVRIVPRDKATLEKIRKADQQIARFGADFVQDRRPGVSPAELADDFEFDEALYALRHDLIRAELLRRAGKTP